MNAHLDASAVRFVEASLVRVHGATAQETLAEQLGYLCHSPISRNLSKVNEGKKDGLLACYTARELLTLAMYHPALADALRAALNTTPVNRDSNVAGDLCALGQRFTGEVNEILGDLSDGIDAREADKHLDALDLISANLWRTRAALIDHKAKLKEKRA